MIYASEENIAEQPLVATDDSESVAREIATEFSNYVSEDLLTDDSLDTNAKKRNAVDQYTGQMGKYLDDLPNHGVSPDAIAMAREAIGTIRNQIQDAIDLGKTPLSNSKFKETAIGTVPEVADIVKTPEQQKAFRKSYERKVEELFNGESVAEKYGFAKPGGPVQKSHKELEQEVNKYRNNEQSYLAAFVDSAALSAGSMGGGGLLPRKLRNMFTQITPANMDWDNPDEVAWLMALRHVFQDSLEKNYHKTSAAGGLGGSIGGFMLPTRIFKLGTAGKLAAAMGELNAVTKALNSAKAAKDMATAAKLIAVGDKLTKSIKATQQATHLGSIAAVGASLAGATKGGPLADGFTQEAFRQAAVLWASGKIGEVVGTVLTNRIMPYVAPKWQLNPWIRGTAVALGGGAANVGQDVSMRWMLGQEQDFSGFNIAMMLGAGGATAAFGIGEQFRDWQQYARMVQLSHWLKSNMARNLSAADAKRAQERLDSYLTSGLPKEALPKFEKDVETWDKYHEAANPFTITGETAIAAAEAAKVSEANGYTETAKAQRQQADMLNARLQRELSAALEEVANREREIAEQGIYEAETAKARGGEPKNEAQGKSVQEVPSQDERVQVRPQAPEVAPPAAQSTERATRNRVFRGGSPIKLRAEGVFRATDESKAYRTTGDAQIADIVESGQVRSKEGKIKGGRKNETHWSAGHPDLAYGSGKIIQTSINGLDERQGGIPLSEIEAIWENRSGVWVNILDSIKAEHANKTAAKQVAEPPAPPSPESVTPASAKPVAPVADIVPALRIGGKLVRGNQGDSHRDILDRHIAENPDSASDVLMDFDTKENPNLFTGPNGEEISRAELKAAHGVSDAQGLRELQAKQKAAQPDAAPAAEQPSLIEQAIAAANWRGTVREVPAPRSMGGEGVKLYIPVDAAGNDVSVGGQTILGKTPAEAIELAQKNVKQATAPVAATTQGRADTDDYRMQHRPNSDGPQAYDLLSTDLAPRDIYDRPDYYTGEPASKGFKESIAALRKIRGKPDAEVTIYRASPKNTLNEGDWVSFSKTYSKQHGMADDPSADVPVHAFKVKARDVRWAGDTLEEFGYYPEKTAPSSPAPATAAVSVPEKAPDIGAKQIGDKLQERLDEYEMVYRERPEMLRALAEDAVQEEIKANDAWGDWYSKNLGKMEGVDAAEIASDAQKKASDEVLAEFRRRLDAKQKAEQDAANERQRQWDEARIKREQEEADSKARQKSEADYAEASRILKQWGVSRNSVSEQLAALESARDDATNKREKNSISGKEYWPEKSQKAAAHYQRQIDELRKKAEDYLKWTTIRDERALSRVKPPATDKESLTVQAEPAAALEKEPWRFDRVQADEKAASLSDSELIEAYKEAYKVPANSWTHSYLKELQRRNLWPLSAKEAWQMTRSERGKIEPDTANHGIFKTKNEADARLSEMTDTISKSPAMMKILSEFGMSASDAYQVSKSTKTGKWSLAKTHQHEIALALRDGKPVPAEVLADYPELAKPAPTPEAAQKETTVTTTVGRGKKLYLYADLTTGKKAWAKDPYEFRELTGLKQASPVRVASGDSPAPAGYTKTGRLANDAVYLGAAPVGKKTTKGNYIPGSGNLYGDAKSILSDAITFGSKEEPPLPESAPSVQAGRPEGDARQQSLLEVPKTPRNLGDLAGYRDALRRVIDKQEKLLAEIPYDRQDLADTAQDRLNKLIARLTEVEAKMLPTKANQMSPEVEPRNDSIRAERDASMKRMAAGKAEDQGIAMTYESPSGGRASIRISSERYQDLSEDAKTQVDQAFRTTLSLNEKEANDWEKIKSGKRSVTLISQDRPGGEHFERVSLDAPEVEAKSWVTRGDLYDAEYNPAAKELRDKILSERQAKEDSETKAKADETARFEKNRQDWREYEDRLRQVPLPTGKKAAIKVNAADKKGGTSSVELSGTQYGKYLIHKTGTGSNWEPTRYKVTHVQSGLGVSGDGFHSLETAKQYVRALMDSGLESDFADQGKLPKSSLEDWRNFISAWNGRGTGELPILVAKTARYAQSSKGKTKADWLAEAKALGIVIPRGSDTAFIKDQIKRKQARESIGTERSQTGEEAALESRLMNSPESVDQANAEGNKLLANAPDETRAAVEESVQLHRLDGTWDEALQRAEESTKDDNLKRVIAALRQQIKKLGLGSKKIVNMWFARRSGGIAWSSGEIGINPLNSPEKVRQDLAHEIGHQVTESKWNAFESGKWDSLSPSDIIEMSVMKAAMQAAIRNAPENVRSILEGEGTQQEKLAALRRMGLDSKTLNRFYGLTSPHEFIANLLTNPTFQNHLDGMKETEIQSVLRKLKEPVSGQTLLQRLFQALKNLWAGKKLAQTSLADSAFNSSLSVIMSGGEIRIGDGVTRETVARQSFSEDGTPLLHDIVPAIRVNGKAVPGRRRDEHIDILNRLEGTPEHIDALLAFDTKESPNFFVDTRTGAEISRAQLKELFGVSDSQGLRELQDRTPEPRFSLPERITPEQDRAYADAVARGDMATAQAMVDAAAKKAGYDSSEPFYWGARKEGQKINNIGDSLFVTDSYDAAKDYAHSKNEPQEFYLRGKIAEVGDVDVDWSSRQFNEYHLEGGDTAEDIDFGQLLGHTGFRKEIAGMLKKEGFTAVRFNGDVSSNGQIEHDSWLVVDPSQIKSSDPITRDAFPGTESSGAKFSNLLGRGETSAVESSVVASIKNSKVLDPIIESIPVDVVNVFGSKERATDMLLHDPAGFQNALSVNADPSVGLFEWMRFRDNAMGVVAGARTELGRTSSSQPASLNGKMFAAVDALQNNLISILRNLASKRLGRMSDVPALALSKDAISLGGEPAIARAKSPPSAKDNASTFEKLDTADFARAFDFHKKHAHTETGTMQVSRIIPLSERFNPESPDIRQSIPDESGDKARKFSKQTEDIKSYEHLDPISNTKSLIRGGGIPESVAEAISAENLRRMAGYPRGESEKVSSRTGIADSPDYGAASATVGGRMWAERSVRDDILSKTFSTETPRIDTEGIDRAMRTLERIGVGSEAFVLADRKAGVVYKVFNPYFAGIGLRAELSPTPGRPTAVFLSRTAGNFGNILEKAAILSHIGVPTEVLGADSSARVLVKQPIAASGDISTFVSEAKALGLSEVDPNGDIALSGERAFIAKVGGRTFIFNDAETGNVMNNTRGVPRAIDIVATEVTDGALKASKTLRDAVAAAKPLRGDVRFSLPDESGGKARKFSQQGFMQDALPDRTQFGSIPQMGGLADRRTRQEALDAVRGSVFDGSVVSQQNSAKAWKVIEDWMTTQSDYGRMLYDLANGNDMVYGALQNELIRYAIKSKDSTMLFTMVDNANKLQGAAVGMGGSEYGRALGGFRGRAYVWDALGILSLDKAVAGRKGVGLTDAEFTALNDKLNKLEIDNSDLLKKLADIEDSLPGSRVLDHSQKFIDSLNQKASTAKQRLAGLGLFNAASGRRGDARLSLEESNSKPVWFDDAVTVGTSLVALKKNESKDQFMAALKDEIGDTEGILDTFADQLWEASNSRLESEIAKAEAASPGSTGSPTRRRAATERPKKPALPKPEKTAQQILDTYAKTQSDTQGWPKKTANEVREIVNRYLSNKTSLNADNPGEFKDALRSELESAEVAPETAERLADVVFTEKANRIKVALESEMDKIASGGGKLRGLINMILAAPRFRQADPAWRRQTAEDYFLQSGLTAEYAAEAAKRFDVEFVKALEKAQDKAVNEIVKSGKNTMQNVSKLKEALRMNLFGHPDWMQAVASELGWKGLTPDQMAELNRLDMESEAPGANNYDAALAKAKMIEIIHGSMTHKHWTQSLPEAYMFSALAGSPTLTVNLFNPVIAIARDLMTELVTNPGNAQFAFRSFFDAVSRIGSQVKWAFKNDVYAFHQAEYFKTAGGLKTIMNDALATLKDPSASAAKRTKALGALAYGSTSLVGKILSALDQAAQATAHEFKTALYSSRVMKDAGFSRSDIDSLQAAVREVRQTVYDDAVINGMDANDAVMRASAAGIDAYYKGIREKVGAEAAEEIAKASKFDPQSIVGLRDESLKAGDEGYLSNKLMVNDFIEMLSKVKSSDDAGKRLMAIAIFGFVAIPFRTLQFFAGFSPYGLVRYARWKKLTNKGENNENNPWKQSYGTKIQAQARLREAWVGTGLMVLAGMFSGSTADDDGESSGIFITGAGPDTADKGVRDAWLKKWSPYTLHIRFFGVMTKMPLGRTGESMLPAFGFAGALDDNSLGRKHQQGARNPKDLELIAQLMSSYFVTYAQRGFFSAFSRISELKNMRGDEASGLLKSASYAAGPLVPWSSLINSTGKLFVDPIDRSTISGAIKSATPLALLSGKPALNLFGEPINDRTIAGKALTAGSPIVIYAVNPESRHHRLVSMHGQSPATKNRKVLENEVGPIDDETWYRYVKIRGSFIRERMEENFQVYSKMTHEAFNNRMNDLGQAGDRYAKSQLELNKRPKNAPKP